VHELITNISYKVQSNADLLDALIQDNDNNLTGSQEKNKAGEVKLLHEKYIFDNIHKPDKSQNLVLKQL